MDKKTLRWNYIFQYGWVITNIFNSLLLLPLYVKNISSDTLGIWLAANSVLGWMILVDPGVGEVLQQKIAELKGSGDKEEINKLIGSGFIASAIILLLSVVVGFIFYFTIGGIINKNVAQYPHLQAALVISIIATGLLLVSFTMSGINQGLHNSSQVAISSLSANFLFLIINIALLFLGFGVISIAFANLCRALFINIYNISSLQKMLKRENFKIVMQKIHFKKFIKIFSFTSASKIISGFAFGVDMVVLARFIPPSMITVYEINKRPINFANTLIGRHSVALMPSISHAKGSGDKDAIIDVIKKQFKFYCYASLYISFIFCLTYKNLITIWTGADKYAGNTITYLLVAYGFVGLVAYFMSNVGYALGDIKKNSAFNIVRNLFYGVLMFFAARFYGIIGTLVLSLTMCFTIDFFYFGYRVYKLGYLEMSFIRSCFNHWFVIIPLSVLFCLGCNSLLRNVAGVNMNFIQIILSCVLFSGFYSLMIFLIDADLRRASKTVLARLSFIPGFKKN